MNIVVVIDSLLWISKIISLIIRKMPLMLDLEQPLN